ncbi:O-antigen ligase [Cryobacterium sp. TMT3-29-2]|uniref:O-antigen ligase family protein n=1 Tax=Cryobacterium sp. TMT3-29-2 TaxID=2555867 RepID=UPI0010747376|nr:O-antigen ligase family protein [Cryobacterium sp. TMT3-29-2]TFC93391.1 O-antigen ligase domain-containing protein [Cryobacterium sp. TMT3-29-2]
MTSRKILYGLSVLAGVVLAGALGAAPTSIGLVAVAAIATIMVAVVLPLGALIGLWGALLPVWSVSSLDPMVFDAARLAVAIMIMVKSGREHANLWTPAVRRVAVPLGASAIGLVVFGIVSGESGTVNLGVTMLLGLIVGWMVLSRLTNPWALMNGYLVGVTLSGVVLILAGFGYSTITPQTNGGFLRLTGLSPSATLVTYQLAIGAVVAWASIHKGARSGRFVVALMVCLVAMGLSGGRGGVVALGLALLVGARWGWVRAVPAAAIALVGWIAVTLAENAGITFNTLQRFTSSGDGGDLTTGRARLFQDSLDSILTHPVLGSGLSQFEAEYGPAPHVALLTFFVAGGLLCGLPVLWAFWCIARRCLTISPKQFGAAGKAAHLILAVSIASAFLEPNGPFVGIAWTTILLLAVGITSRALEPPRITAASRALGADLTGLTSGPAVLPMSEVSRKAV